MASLLPSLTLILPRLPITHVQAAPTSHFIKFNSLLLSRLRSVVWIENSLSGGLSPLPRIPIRSCLIFSILGNGRGRIFLKLERVVGLRLPAAGLYAIVSRWVPVARDPDGMAMEEGAAAKIAASGSYLRKFKLYETSSNFYMVGRDKSKALWRVLKIDRLEATELNIHEDSTTYSQRECYDLLKRIDEGNRSTGGLKFVTKCYGIVGFIRFLGPYYMLLITERRQIGVICGHRVFAVTVGHGVRKVPKIALSCTGFPLV